MTMVFSSCVVVICTSSKTSLAQIEKKSSFRSRIKNLLHGCQVISFLDSTAYPPF